MLGADGEEEDYVDFTLLFQEQIMTTELGELLLWQAMAQSIYSPPSCPLPALSALHMENPKKSK